MRKLLATTDDDWYPGSQEGERTLYGNIDSKIDAYAAKYPFLNAFYLAEIHRMCAAFVEVFDKVTENRATARQMTSWFDSIVRSKQENTEVPAAPVFQAIVMPSGAMIGLEQQCRAFARLMKNQLNYDKADGLDLLIEKQAGAEQVVDNASPELKISDQPDNSLDFEWKKSGFDMLELQWRKAGDAMWQAADKSTEKVINFTPPDLEPGIPEKFEFRAIYLIKDKRVGQWSPIYTKTVG